MRKLRYINLPKELKRKLFQLAMLKKLRSDNIDLVRSMKDRY